MNFKNFFVAGIAGGIVYYLLGWLLYGTLFFNYFGGKMPVNMAFIALGCFSVAFLISYVFVRWGQITTIATGAKGGAGIGIFLGLMNNFFSNSMIEIPNYEQMLVDTSIMVITCSITGAVVGLVNGKMK